MVKKNYSAFEVRLEQQNDPEPSLNTSVFSFPPKLCLIIPYFNVYVSTYLGRHMYMSVYVYIHAQAHTQWQTEKLKAVI